MKRMRAAVSTVLTLALVLTAPGGQAYAAAGQVAASASKAASAPRVALPGSSRAASIKPLAAVTLGASSLSPLTAAPLAPKALAAAAADARSAAVPAAAAAPVIAPSAAETVAPAPSAAAPISESETSAGRVRFDLAAEKPASELSVAGAAGAASVPLARASASARRSVAVPAAAPRFSSVKGLLGAGVLFGTGMSVAGMAFGGIAVFPMIIGSLILHEIGHARMAARLGDSTATWGNRGSFNPKHWHTHIDPMMTIVIPAMTFLMAGMIFGGARPVPVDPSNLKDKHGRYDPINGMAKVAFAGPAMNLGLAAAGSMLLAVAYAAGLGAATFGVLATFIGLNAFLAVFNLVPLFPLDGSHLLRRFLPGVSSALDPLYARLGPFGSIMVVLLLFTMTPLGGIVMGTAASISSLLMGLALSAVGAQLAASVLPALGLAGQLASSSPKPAAPPPGAQKYIVVFGATKEPVKLADAHLSQVDVNAPAGVARYTSLQQSMMQELAPLGLDAAAFERLEASPIATYGRINAATVLVDAAKAGEFKKLMAQGGHEVFANDRIEIIRPVPIAPEQMDPASRNPVGMDENLALIKATAVHEAAKKMWGAPDLGFWGRLSRVFSAAPVQPRIGVVDSGVELTHPLLKRVRESKNATSGPNVDDIGHGSWVHSTVLHVAAWLKGTSTHYKTFVDGGATTDDILKALTQSANDGNLVISNSWGGNAGNPKAPSSLLVKKLAEEGHIMVFAAGNAGSGRNTVGDPAIVHVKDAKTGAIRVLAVAAGDRGRRVASFSSRGPRSRMTASDASYPHRPDLMAVGYNIDGAWPAALGDADRVDPKLGPLKAISGTSMSTPGVAGALALLLMMFGVTEKGEKADAVVNAVMSTLDKTGLNDRDSEGEGFLNVTAAYEALVEKFTPGATPLTAFLRREALLAEESLDITRARLKGVRFDRDPASRARRIRRDIALAQLAAKHPGVFNGSLRAAVKAARALAAPAPRPSSTLELTIVATSTTLLGLGFLAAGLLPVGGLMLGFGGLGFILRRMNS